MKIAITSNGSTLDDQVETRFGRSPYFIFANPDTLEFESMPNPNMSLGGGAGPQSAQLMAEKGVSVVLTGNCGPNAFQTFGAAGIQVITGISGRVRARHGRRRRCRRWLSLAHGYRRQGIGIFQHPGRLFFAGRGESGRKRAGNLHGNQGRFLHI